MLDSAYAHITSGKYKSKTDNAIRTLGAVSKVDDYKPFRVEGYTKSMMNMNNVIFNACMRRKTPLTAVVAGLSIAMKEGLNSTNTSKQASISKKTSQRFTKF